ncbi:MAG TPA: hypothetical protein VGR11_01910 [Solirubrobacteraceae bacterium]|nr:hypothetical protein [Solirubrobacteraceae bacterium]
MAEDEVREKIDEAHEENVAKAEDSGATTGEAKEDAVVGHHKPETGSDDAPESEIPKGVDALTDEQIAQAEEAGPAAGGGGDDDDGALDVAALMEEGGGDDAAAEDDATPDDDVAGPDAAEEET